MEMLEGTRDLSLKPSQIIMDCADCTITTWAHLIWYIQATAWCFDGSCGSSCSSGRRSKQVTFLGKQHDDSVLLELCHKFTASICFFYMTPCLASGLLQLLLYQDPIILQATEPSGKGPIPFQCTTSIPASPGTSVCEVSQSKSAGSLGANDQDWLKETSNLK